MGVRALQFVQDVTRKYCITVEHCYFGQLVFSVLSAEQVGKGSSDSSLSLLQTSRDEQIVGGQLPSDWEACSPTICPISFPRRRNTTDQQHENKKNLTSSISQPSHWGYERYG